MSCLSVISHEGWNEVPDPGSALQVQSWPEAASDRLSYYALDLEPGHRECLDAWLVGTVESVTVIAGRVTLFDGRDIWHLGVGDRLITHPDIMHRYDNVGSETAVLCFIVRE